MPSKWSPTDAISSTSVASRRGRARHRWTPDELARIEPILTELASTLDAAVSIDTYKAKVAARAVELGAVLVNDVWGLQKDPEMADVVAAAEAAVVIMHNRAEKDASIDILTDIRRSFDRSWLWPISRNPQRPHHPRPRHRLCQNVTSEPRCDRPPRGAQGLCAADNGRCFSQDFSRRPRRWKRRVVVRNDRRQPRGRRQRSVNFSRARRRSKPRSAECVSRVAVTQSALSWRAINSLSTSRALSVWGPGFATHSWTEFSNKR